MNWASQCNFSSIMVASYVHWWPVSKGLIPSICILFPLTMYDCIFMCNWGCMWGMVLDICSIELKVRHK